MNQIKAGFKKEFYFFSRTFRMWGVIIAIAAFAVLDPFMLKMAAGFGDSMNEVLSEYAEADEPGVQQSIDEASAALDGMQDILSELGAPEAAASSLTDISATALLVILLVLMGTSGGEQKKRSIIIPRQAGLTPFNYVFPKFVFYPCCVIILASAGAALSGLIANSVFDGEKANILLCVCGGAVIGIYLSFIMCAHFAFGISTGKAGISVAVIFILSRFIPIILSVYGADRFNPFALVTAAPEIITGNADPLNIAVSILTSVILILIFFFITLFVLNTQQIDNTSDSKLDLL